ncbi:IS66 family transposase, partial [Cupriavidus basilensis]|uniref:IS66 family transposase n=1 Tax=Cupriavidus basilensis TaxID=68895 RepID=UPI0023E8CC75
RELIYIWETTQQTWAQDMITLLRQAKREADDNLTRGNTSLAPARLADYRRRAEALVAQGQQDNPAQARNPALDPRGKTKQSFAYNLLARLQRYATEVWRFIADHRVPFDNNQAERDIRMPKLKQKISGGFRVTHGLQAFCTIRSYLATLRKQKRELFTALTCTFSGCPPSPIPGC